ncbi:hypothetical protein LINPERHAP1_LOCUS10407, partial [Linum perenne]
ETLGRGNKIGDRLEGRYNNRRWVGKITADKSLLSEIE